MQNPQNTHCTSSSPFRRGGGEVVCEHDQYFYHTDHLGSSSFISDLSGAITQHLQYLPFGETFIEQRNTSNYYTPYKFSAKEKDEETGFSYFGARYYLPEVSVWLSVDPLADHPNQVDKSPYSAFWNNPILYTDPDGRFPIIPIIWAAVEIGSGIYDAYQAYKTLNDKNASKTEKATVVGGLAASVLLPGGGYTTAGKATVKAVDKVNDAAKVTDKTLETSRAARRESMREEGIPTGQQPKSQSKNSSGREYTYETPKKGGGTQTKSVQQQTMDRSHQGQNHWEAGKVRKDADGNVKMNNYGRPRLDNEKSKVNY